MALLALDPWRLAVGLDWRLASSRAELSGYAQSAPAGGEVRARHADGVLVGLYPRAPHWRQRLYAGALLVARRFREALVYQPAGDGVVWFCAIQDGLPLPDSDRLCSTAEADHLLSDYQSLLPDAVILGQHPAARSDLLQALAPSSAADKRAAQLRRRRSRLLPWLVIALVASLVAAGFLFQPRQQEVTFTPPPRALPTPTVDLAELRRQFDRQIAEARAKLLEQAPLAHLADAWFQALASLPPSVEGYRAEQLACTPLECEVIWVADPLAGKAPRLPGENLGRGGDGRLRSRLPLPPAPALTATVLVSGEFAPYRDALAASLRRIGARADFGTASTPITVPPPNGLTGAVPYVLGQRQPLRVTVAGWANARSTVNLLATTPFVAQRATLSRDNGRVSLQMEGHYVVADE